MINKTLQATLSTLLCITASQCLADASSDLDTLVRGHYDRNQLNERGYQWTAQKGNHSHKAEFWYNADHDSCAKILIHNGIIDQVENASVTQCQQRNTHAYRPAAATTTQTASNLDPSLMPRYCSGEAASRFHVSPRDITTLPLEKSGQHYVVYGQWEQNDIHTFTCTFSHNGQLESLQRTS